MMTEPFDLLSPPQLDLIDDAAVFDDLDRFADFPRRLADWLDRHGTIVDTLLALRRRGPRADAAVQALVATRPTSTVRWSWALWECLIAGDGEDPEDLLLEVLPVATIERARLALWGPDWRTQDEPDGAFQRWSA